MGLFTVSEARAELARLRPVLDELDFPSDLDGVPVLLGRLEGESELGRYHRLDLGFAGRRRLAWTAAETAAT